MFQAPVPPSDGLPTRRDLLRSTVIALAIAAVILITVVLPAEYGIDPTGVGQVIGLKRMGEIKVALALEAEAALAAETEALTAEPVAAEVADASAAAPVAAEDAVAEDSGKPETIEITLQPDEGKEVKLRMIEGASVNYEWWTGAGVVNSELHADYPPNSGAAGFHSYRKGRAESGDEGILTAAFDGMHGWFWRNRTDQAVTVTLQVEGDFLELREMS